MAFDPSGIVAAYLLFGLGLGALVLMMNNEVIWHIQSVATINGREMSYWETVVALLLMFTLMWPLALFKREDR